MQPAEFVSPSPCQDRTASFPWNAGWQRPRLSRLALQLRLHAKRFLRTPIRNLIEFLESLTTEWPDCVVLDLHMPVMNGFEVQAQLADLRVTIPVVIITGHDSDETRALALAGFPVAYLRKPVNDQLLLDAIALALRRSLQQLGARNE